MRQAGIEEMIPAWTITIQLMGSDLGPDDDETTIKRKLNVAANKLTMFTGAKNLEWTFGSRPAFSFTLYLPGAEIPRMFVEIERDNSDTYTLEIARIGTTRGVFPKVEKTIRGLSGDALKRTFERTTNVFLSF